MNFHRHFWRRLNEPVTKLDLVLVLLCAVMTSAVAILFPGLFQ